jgi:hypothetical protein
MSALQLKQSALRLAAVDSRFGRVDPAVLFSEAGMRFPYLFPGGRYLGLLGSDRRRFTLHRIAQDRLELEQLILPDTGFQLDLIRMCPVSADDVVLLVSYHQLFVVFSMRHGIMLTNIQNTVTLCSESLHTGQDPEPSDCRASVRQQAAGLRRGP